MFIFRREIRCCDEFRCWNCVNHHTGAVANPTTTRPDLRTHRMKMGNPVSGIHSCGSLRSTYPIITIFSTCHLKEGKQCRQCIFPSMFLASARAASLLSCHSLFTSSRRLSSLIHYKSMHMYMYIAHTNPLQVWIAHWVCSPPPPSPLLNPSAPRQIQCAFRYPPIISLHWQHSTSHHVHTMNYSLIHI